MIIMISTAAIADYMTFVSTMIYPASETEINDSCVERGRWRYDTNAFKSSYYSNPSVRKSLTSNLSGKKTGYVGRESVQSSVWDEVDGFMKDLNCESETSSLAEGMKKMEEEVKNSHKNLNLPNSACGLLVLAGDKLIGLDLFDSPMNFKRYRDKLTRSFLVEGLRNKEKLEKSDRQMAENFIADLKEQLMTAEKHEMNENVLEFKSDKMTGNLMLFEEKICHLAVFENSEPKPVRSRDYPIDNNIIY